MDNQMDNQMDRKKFLCWWRFLGIEKRLDIISAISSFPNDVLQMACALLEETGRLMGIVEDELLPDFMSGKFTGNAVYVLVDKDDAFVNVYSTLYSAMKEAKKGDDPETDLWKWQYLDKHWFGYGYSIFEVIPKE